MEGIGAGCPPTSNKETFQRNIAWEIVVFDMIIAILHSLLYRIIDVDH